MASRCCHSIASFLFSLPSTHFLSPSHSLKLKKVPVTFIFLSRRTKSNLAQYDRKKMCVDRILSNPSTSLAPANFRLCNVSGIKMWYCLMTELLEIQADNPILHVLFIPGNPGIVTFYLEFIQSLYGLLEGAASVTAIGHVSHSSKDYEHGRLFSLQEQIDHKMDYIAHELQNSELPIILVGHSIGSYMSIEMFKRAPNKVVFCIALYPFLTLNPKSSQQTAIRNLAESKGLSVTVSLLVALLGLIPTWGKRFIVKRTLVPYYAEYSILGYDRV